MKIKDKFSNALYKTAPTYTTLRSWATDLCRNR